MLIAYTMDALMNLRIVQLERRRRQVLRRRQHLRQLRDHSDPFSVTEEVFQGLYRFSKNMTRALVEELRPILNVGQLSTALPIEIKILCALHFYGQGCYQKSVGSSINVSLSHASVSRAIDEVTSALNTPAVLTKWIVVPNSLLERRVYIEKHYESSQIPGVLGFVDGTHIAIRKPYVDEHLYVNRKSIHTINTQIVCDSQLKIINVLARYPGASHDSFVWSNSRFRRLLEEVWRGGEECWLLGDSGYPNEPWLMTPILHAEEGNPEAKYTHMHARARCAVERCIGVLKGRFRCLSRGRMLEYSPRKVCRIINACCVLHNKCVQDNLIEPLDLVEEDLDFIPPIEEPGHIADVGRTVRERLIMRLAYPAGNPRVVPA